MESSIPRRYAKAIFELAVEENQFERVGDQLRAASEALQADPAVLAALANPAMTREEKHRIADVLAETIGASATVANALHLLAERGRLGLVPAVERVYRELADDRAGRLRARVTSAVPLEDDAARRIGALLSKATEKNVVLEQQVDASLLGGVVAQVGSRVFDGSLRTQLAELEKHLKA